MGRIRELDSLRGLAALAVVLHHDLFQTGAVSRETMVRLTSTPLMAVIQGRPFVILFFVLSGFVLSRSLAGSKPTRLAYLRWSLQRIIRLVVPTFAAVLLSALLYRLTFAGSWPGESGWLRSANWAVPPDIGIVAAEGALLRQGTLDNVLWSLIIELRVSLLIPLMVWFGGTRENLWVLFFVTLGLAGLAGQSTPTMLDANTAEEARTLLYFVFPFALGVCLDRSGLCARRAEFRVVVAGLFALAGLLSASLDLAILIGSALIIWLAQQEGGLRTVLRAPVLTWLGTISFSLYLVHVPVLLVAFHLLHASHSATTIAWLAIAASLPAAWLFYLVVERQAHRAARRLSAPRIGQQVLPPRQVSQVL